MSELSGMARMFLVIGVLFLLLGGVLLLADRVPWIGRLPGDLTYESDNVKVYVPLTTMLLLSLLLTLLFNLFLKGN